MTCSGLSDNLFRKPIELGLFRALYFFKFGFDR